METPYVVALCMLRSAPTVMGSCRIRCGTWKRGPLVHSWEFPCPAPGFLRMHRQGVPLAGHSLTREDLTYDRSGAIYRAYGVGAEPADAVAHVSADRDRKRGGAPGCRACRACLGEPGRALVRVGVGDRAVGPDRWR